MSIWYALKIKQMLQKEFLKTLSIQLSNTLQSNIVIEKIQQVYGGDINETFVLHTSAGNYFLKVNSHSQQDMFEKEFNGLQTLRKAHTLHIPEPILHGSFDARIFLVMEYIEKGKPAADFWQQFAAGLAALHRQTQPQFGFKEPNYIGSLIQQNKLTDEWPEFYTTQRIMPLMNQAYEQNKCTAEDVSKAEKLCSRFSELFSKESPALLHGDLWSGNFMVNDKSEPVIYDPAVYYGHREMDIAMTLLFGGFDKHFYIYYNETFPLQKGWEQRVALCQLYPLLVHLILFGGHYYFSVMNIIKSFL
jgi:fructosamine-3-kinase